MRAVVQRVLSAGVEVSGQIVSQIGRGLLVYLSIGKGDSDADAEFIADKLVNLRIIADEAGPTTPLRAGKMNRSIKDSGGDTKRSGEPRRAILLVSNFTLHGDCRKGRRPGFDAAAEPAIAEPLYDKTALLIADKGVKVAKGVFRAYMQVSSVNDGPVTFLLDSSLTREIRP
jgi:D-tyrosyl-tRNA(Tyr) deacylase